MFMLPYRTSLLAATLVAAGIMPFHTHAQNPDPNLLVWAAKDVSPQTSGTCMTRFSPTLDGLATASLTPCATNRIQSLDVKVMTLAQATAQGLPHIPAPADPQALRSFVASAYPSHRGTGTVTPNSSCSAGYYNDLWTRSISLGATVGYYVVYYIDGSCYHYAQNQSSWNQGGNTVWYTLSAIYQPLDPNTALDGDNYTCAALNNSGNSYNSNYSRNQINAYNIYSQVLYSSDNKCFGLSGSQIQTQNYYWSS